MPIQHDKRTPSPNSKSGSTQRLAPSLNATSGRSLNPFHEDSAHSSVADMPSAMDEGPLHDGNTSAAFEVSAVSRNRHPSKVPQVIP